MMLTFHLIILSIIYLGSESCLCQSAPPEMLNTCSFDPVMIMVPSSGFVINQENCDSLIPKETFAEMPFVYFSNADEVSVVVGLNGFFI